jgi:hypothetical protein
MTTVLRAAMLALLGVVAMCILLASLAHALAG